MKIFLIDTQKWILVTKEEMKNIINADLPEYTRASVQPFFLW